MSCQLGRIARARGEEPRVLGHDVCLVIAAADPRGAELRPLGYPVLDDPTDHVALLRETFREVLRATSERGCGVPG